MCVRLVHVDTFVDVLEYWVAKPELLFDELTVEQIVDDFAHMLTMAVYELVSFLGFACERLEVVDKLSTCFLFGVEV